MYVRLGFGVRTQDRAAGALAIEGQAVIRIDMDDVYDLGREFFRWEFATAVAGAILGDQSA